MSLSDAEKKELILLAFHRKLRSVKTLAGLKTFLSNVTKERIITFIKQEIQVIMDERSQDASELQVDGAALQDEIDNV